MRVSRILRLLVKVANTSTLLCLIVGRAGGRVGRQIASFGKKPSQVHLIIIREYLKTTPPPPAFKEILIIFPLVHFIRSPLPPLLPLQLGTKEY